MSRGFERWLQTRLTARAYSSGPVLRIVLSEWVEADRLEPFCRHCLGERREVSSVHQCLVMDYDGSFHDYVGVCQEHMVLIDRSLFE
jgi:hypothetical protein